MTSVRDDAVLRCREAFESNRIPWDHMLESLPVHKLHETAEYWERRFIESKGDSVSRPAFASSGPLRPLVSLMAGFPHTGGSGGRTRRQQMRMLRDSRARSRRVGFNISDSPCGDGGILS